MKEKEEDEEINENICRQTDNQSRSNLITEATLFHCGLWIVGERANFVKTPWYSGTTIQ